MIQEQLNQLLTGNTLFTSGALLIIAQSVWSSVRGMLGELFQYLKDRFVYRLTFSTSSASSYKAMLRFLKTYRFLDGVRNLRQSQVDSDFYITEDAFNFKWFKSTLIFYTFSIRDLSQGTEHWNRHDQSIIITKEENFSLTYIGLSSEVRDEIENLINSFRDEEIINTDTHFLLYLDGSQKVSLKRPLNSIFLPDNQLDHIVQDIQAFRNAKQMYLDKSVNYKRVYLLEGVPGSGKSSLVKALASHFNTKLRVIENTNALLKKEICLEFTKNETFVLIEEIDTVGAKKRKPWEDDDDAPDESPSMIEDAANKKLKELLTILDGIHTPEGLVIFLTTNHIEKLDAALIRPGRVDYRLSFKSPDKSQIESACKYYLGDKWEAVYKNLVKTKPTCMSAVQEALIQEYLSI